jgi:hypothetical protein
MEVVATRSHQQAAVTKYAGDWKGVNKSARNFRWRQGAFAFADSLGNSGRQRFQYLSQKQSED